MASKRRIRRKMRENKTRYSSSQEAKSAAYHVRKDKKENLTIYRCPFCNGFHYGHPPAKRPYTRRKRKQLARGHH